MPGDVGGIKYSLPEPFEQAVKSVCRSLASSGLVVAGQLDVSERVQRSLGIVMPPCRIIFVLPDRSMSSTATIHPAAAIFLPFHVVLSGNGPQTDILVQNKVYGGLDATTPALAAPVAETQTHIIEAIDAIAMRPSLVV